MQEVAQAMGRRAVLSICIGQLCAGILGCDSDPEVEQPEIAVRDSAGIEIIENAGAVWNDETRWKLGSIPTFEIGVGVGGDPALQFAYIEDVHRLASGEIAVVDAWAPAVAFFDAQGRPIGRVGRRGTGPGEFPTRSVPYSFTCGTDSVYVVVNLNVAVYVPPGEYVRTFPLGQPSTVRTCGSQGIVVETTYGPWRGSPGTFTDSTLIVALSSDGSEHVVIDTLPRQISDWVRGPEGTGYTRAPFSPTLSLAVSDSIMALGFGDRFEVEIRNEVGVPRRIIRVVGLDRTVGGSDVSAFLDYVLNPWRGNEDERRQIEQKLRSTEGQPLPAFSELRFDAAGNLWARAFDNVDAVAFYDYSRFIRGVARATVAHPRRWMVISRSGRYLGVVDTPPNFTVHDIGEESVLGVWRDELDIQYVRQYPLVKPGS